MNCPLCGYAMDAFDIECRRCHGKGLPSAAQPQTTAQAAAPIGGAPAAAPSLGAAPATISPVAAPAAPPTTVLPISGFHADTTNYDQHLMAFVISAVVFYLGYLSPWLTLSLFGLNASVGGQMGLEFFIFVLAVIAAGVAIYERSHQHVPFWPQLRAGLAAACFIFASGEFLYISFLLHIVQLGFGLPLMFIAAGVMTYLAVLRVPSDSRTSLLRITGLVLLATLAGSGYRGYSLRKGSDWGSTFSSGSRLGMGGSAEPEARTDVDIRLDSSTPTPSLVPTSDFYQPLTADAGKIYLICKVTVTYKGTTGSLRVDANRFRVTASNKQIYRSKNLFNDVQNFKPIEATLLPGGTATGDILFEVDNGATPEKVEFVSGLF